MSSSKKEKIPLLDPRERLQILSNCSNAFEVDPHIPPRRYYRSGNEMVRMANVYYSEGNLENAYVLYMKFMTLFIEKIRKHPGYNQVSSSLKTNNQITLREILPKAEKLKQELLQQYTKEYNVYKLIKEKEDEEARRAKEALEKHEREVRESKKSLVRDESAWASTPILLPPSNIGSISYPDPTVSNLDTVVSDKLKPFNPSSSQFNQPTIDRTSKPSIVATGGGLRTVVIPSTVMPKFLMLASRNTMNNIETCGVLAGILEQNELIITHMILPKQKGTSDSCATMNEEELFDYQDQHNLITIGWIHTHPTQTAFLSSVDLHTHCPYQLLMPEAIAIVCAPKYNDTGIFVLTPNYGLEFISNCRSVGFHPHPTDPPLFMTANHIKLDGSSTLEVLDLR